ncbi:MAG: 5'/3'-nucleotidase SurE [Planctomycetota bacterium]
MPKPLRVLLTNDDGIDAEGLHALHRSVTQVFHTHFIDQPYEIFVVAPDRGRSECGHSIETSTSLKVTTREPDWFAVNGTPVDCIRVAQYALKLRPDVVFSGINAGANLGVNLMVSGTFAAAREASLLGIPALAASHYRRPDVDRTWDHAPTWLADTVSNFVAQCVASTDRPDPENSEAARIRPAFLWNVNLPAITPRREGESFAVPPAITCDVDRCPIDRDGSVAADGNVRFDLDFHGRAREAGRDVDQCFGGKITVSELFPHCF